MSNSQNVTSLGSFKISRAVLFNRSILVILLELTCGVGVDEMVPRVLAADINFTTMATFTTVMNANGMAFPRMKRVHGR